MIGSPKKWLVLGSLVAGSIIFGTVGGYFVFQWRCHAAFAMQERLWEHIMIQREAQAYFRLLQAQESGKTNDLRRFRNRASVVLRLYVHDVAQVQKRYGSEWSPLDSQFHKQAQQYLADHPAIATNVPAPVK
jgi:hypothetical protein